MELVAVPAVAINDALGLRKEEQHLGRLEAVIQVLRGLGELVKSLMLFVRSVRQVPYNDHAEPERAQLLAPQGHLEVPTPCEAFHLAFHLYSSALNPQSPSEPRSMEKAAYGHDCHLAQAELSMSSTKALRPPVSLSTRSWLSTLDNHLLVATLCNFTGLHDRLEPTGTVALDIHWRCRSPCRLLGGSPTSWPSTSSFLLVPLESAAWSMCSPSKLRST
mmetsp:Transcript_110223/g.351301  ORF Transcript_110223/g.351301 Transcript_110223/m.351301 type:complete len:219 (-) Transcript_110223:1498-2154(-)